MNRILIILAMAALFNQSLVAQNEIQAPVPSQDTQAAPAFGSQNTQTPPAIPSQEQPEVLNQGPIHEGYAQPLEVVPQAGLIAPQQPPPDITENPSAERPSGTNYVWIPGYWAWDTQQQTYLWVSGCWRVPPAGMSWMPGYWKQVPQGWQWVAGFWIPSSEANRVQYLPQPPDIPDLAPAGGWSNPNQVWVPPCYYWVNNAYTLRAGYWLTPPGDWMWIPSHYTWSPYGCVFVPGYWDYPLPMRGVLYAPFYFPPHFYGHRGFELSLGVVVNVGNLEFSLFSYPRYCHYYFGDYYDDFYAGIGIFPWFAFETHHGWYDPIYEHDRYHYRHSIPHWDDHIRHEYDMRRADRDLRPPRTYRDVESRVANVPRNEQRNLKLVEPIQTYAESRNTPVRFTRMNDRTRRNVQSHAQEVNAFREQRRQIESRPMASTAAPSQGTQRIQPQARTEERPTERAPAPTTKQPRAGTEEQRAERAPAPTVEQPQARTERRERAPETRMEQPRAEDRRSSEQRNFPKSPVTGKSRGLFQQAPPAKPQTEQRVEQRGGNRDGKRESRRQG